MTRQHGITTQPASKPVINTTFATQWSEWILSDHIC